MTFYPIDDIDKFSDEEINRKITELRSRIMRAYQMGLGFDITRQLEILSESFQGEQQRRQAERAQQQQLQEEQQDNES